MQGGFNELRVASEVWSMEVCEVSLTKNLRGKPAKIRLGKSWKILRKILRGYLCSRGMSVYNLCIVTNLLFVMR
jgi:hypothetical protein